MDISVVNAMIPKYKEKLEAPSAGWKKPKPRWKRRRMLLRMPPRKWRSSLLGEDL